MVGKGLILFGALLGTIVLVQGAPSQEQRNSAVAQLKELVKDELVEKHMKEDYWLESWLSKTNYNVEGTKKLLEQYLKFRKEHGLATILDEDWSDLRAKFPYSHNTVDKSGRPVVYIDVQDFDMDSLLSKKDDSATKRFLRYWLMFAEDNENHVRQLRSKGNDVTQYRLIANLGGYDEAKHMCKDCLKMYPAAGRISSGATYDITLVNVPNSYKTFHESVKPGTPPRMTLYGQNRDAWLPKLLEIIDSNQLPKGILNPVAHIDNNNGLIAW